MRLRTVFRLIERATTGRLLRLSRRLAPDPDVSPRPRHYVRYLWITWICDVLQERAAALVTDN